MPSVDHINHELLFKVVYYGPGLGGKTTNLEYIHKTSRPGQCGRLVSLCSETERTLFFDLLPVGLGKYKGYSIRLHLCTVPGQVFKDKIRKLILTNVDGIVFVVDSQEAMVDSNLAALENLWKNLTDHGVDPSTIPAVIQYNKRDLDKVLSLPQLRKRLGVPKGLVEIEASARYGVGVAETLKAIVRECIRATEAPSRMPSGRTPSILPGHRVSMYPQGRAPGSAAAIPPPANTPHIEPGIEPKIEAKKASGDG